MLAVTPKTMFGNVPQLAVSAGLEKRNCQTKNKQPMKKETENEPQKPALQQGAVMLSFVFETFGGLFGC